MEVAGTGAGAVAGAATVAADAAPAAGAVAVVAAAEAETVALAFSSHENQEGSSTTVLTVRTCCTTLNPKPSASGGIAFRVAGGGALSALSGLGRLMFSAQHHAHT